MKEYARLKATADLMNHPQNYLVMRFMDNDPGEFNLPPLMDDTGIFLASSEAPAYRVKIEGDNPETLERVGKAILALARKQKKEDEPEG